MNPDVDRTAASTVLAFNTSAVDVDLNDAGRDHGRGRNHETHCDTLDWSEPDVGLAESWVEEGVDEWNEDDERERVEVVDQIVWNAAEVEGG